MTKEQMHLTEKGALGWREAPSLDLCVLVCAWPPSSPSSLSPMRVLGGTHWGLWAETEYAITPKPPAHPHPDAILPPPLHSPGTARQGRPAACPVA